jgi:hypothetical protein
VLIAVLGLEVEKHLANLPIFTLTLTLSHTGRGNKLALTQVNSLKNIFSVNHVPGLFANDVSG